MGDARPPGASDTAMQRRGLVASETGGIVAIAVLDSLALAGTSTGDIVVWDMDTNTVKTTLTGHTEKIADIVVEPAGQRAVSASYDGTARVWCLLEFTCLHVLEGHESWLRSVDVYDGLVLTAGGDNTARVWSIDRGVHENTLLGHTDWVKAVRVHRPDRSVTVTGSWDATVRTWSTDTGSLLKTVTCDSAVRCLCDNSKKLEAVAGCVSGSVSIIDLSVGVIRVQLLPPQHDPTNAVRSHMHAILAATSAATVHVWTCDGPSIGVFKQHTAFVNDVSVAPDGTCVSVDGEGHVFAWEMETRRVLFEDATEAPALCCTATGNDETTCLACGLENGRVLSVRFASRDVDTEKPADTTTSW
ncbi:hypothetical protein PTSG_02574 [Salpingoeca rosetta]|uniref:Uncharacterized protein n=1 Tax=Salpingoeca rosetta (strain ATCC 50818 / BSB-021) TaxID=946362 RepID=F2U2P4_SALR5|nr:uncharacterized protein PTSG_02574 [Salpingoeca rosetta]EGD81888.1 hypothetical protein PTSG_02574 [Salpingoeca rosetta]|eukprot:XP_004996071.1 hypothetical protein PTSG_02574 [Salpingoeca rosetta]